MFMLDPEQKKELLNDYKNLMSFLRKSIRFFNRCLVAYTPKSKLRLVFNRRVNVIYARDRTSKNYRILARGHKIKTTHVTMMPYEDANLYVLVHKARKATLKLLRILHSYVRVLENF